MFRPCVLRNQYRRYALITIHAPRARSQLGPSASPETARSISRQSSEVQWALQAVPRKSANAKKRSEDVLLSAITTRHSILSPTHISSASNVRRAVIGNCAETVRGDSRTRQWSIWLLRAPRWGSVLRHPSAPSSLSTPAVTQPWLDGRRRIQSAPGFSHAPSHEPCGPILCTRRP